MILKRIVHYSILSLMLMIFSSCENVLEEETFSSLGPSNFYETASDAEALLNSVYANTRGYRDLLRDQILLERSWEFHTEALRRQDLIRHGKFIEMAQARGKAAQDFHVLFPIPQSEIDRNPNLGQNPGY